MAFVAVCACLALTPEAGEGQAPAACQPVEDQLALPLPMRTCGWHDSGSAFDGPTALRDGRVGTQSDDELLGTGRAFLYSALLPGASQWKMGQRRWIAYLILEGVSWVAFGRARTSAVDLRDRYETLAWDVARTFSGPRVDGDFAYYETLEKFESSGAFDVDPTTSGIQPQTNPSTFNGSTWALAMQIFFAPGTDPAPGDPQYEDALAFYRAEGYDERFEWTWAGSPGEWDEYGDVIASSDRDFRRASQFAGVVIANHLLSAADGFITARVRAAAGERSMARFRVARAPITGELELILQVRH